MGNRSALIFGLALIGVVGALAPASYLTPEDRLRLEAMFVDNLAKDELASSAYAAMGLRLLGEAVPDPQGTLCAKLQTGVDDAASVAAIYQAASAAKDLKPKCKLTLSAAASQVVNSAAGSDESLPNLMHGALAKQLLGDYDAADGAAVTKVLDLARSALKKDGSVTNLGCAFFLASQLNTAGSTSNINKASAGKKTASPPNDLEDIFAKVGNALAQADEVDGKVLQFEGGLATAYLVVVGAYGLAEKLGQAPPKLTKMQSVKLGNYFLGHKNSRHSKGGYMVLRALDTLANNAHQVPVAFTLVSRPYVSESSPVVRIRVTDLLGRPVVSAGKKAVQVRIESAMRVSDGAVAFSNQLMTPVPDQEGKGDSGSTYELDLFKASSDQLFGRGFYELTVTADFGDDAASGNRLAGNVGALLSVKAVTAIELEDAELRIEELDGSTSPKVHKLVYPGSSSSSLEDLLEADRHHRIVLKFRVVDKATKEAIKVHQAFVRLTEVSSGSEIIFVASVNDDSGYYKFEMGVKEKTKEFSGVSGAYDVELIVGDAVVLNPVRWKVATIDLAFSGNDYVANKKDSVPQGRSSKGPQPEIRHVFRQPDVRPPSSVSMAFTALCLMPFLIMFALWMRLGVNVSAFFPGSLPAVGFYLGLGAIFGLYYLFWLQMDMFTTIKYLAMVGIVTFLCGNSMLSRIAEKRKSANSAAAAHSAANSANSENLVR